MKKFIFIFVLLITSQIFASNLSYKVTPDNVIKRIITVGAKKSVIELYNNDFGWSAVLRGIESGEENWLDVALLIKPGTDAGASSMLKESLGLGFEKNPVGVLSRFTTDDLRIICIVDPVGDQTLNSSLSYDELIEKRKSILMSID